MHNKNHLTSVRDDLGDLKTYCTECGRFVVPSPPVMIPVENRSMTPNALREANRAYVKALRDSQTNFNLVMFVAASLVILGIMSKVLE